MTRTHILGGALALLLIAPVAKAADIEREFDVAAGGTLDIDTDVGAIDVVPGDTDKVRIEVDLKGSDADRLEIDFEQTPEGVRVKARIKREPDARWETPVGHGERPARRASFG